MSSSSSNLEAVEASLHDAVADFFKSDEGTVLVTTKVVEHLHSKKGKALLSKIVNDALDSKPSADTTPRKTQAKSPPSSIQKVGEALRRGKRARVASSSSEDEEDSSVEPALKDAAALQAAQDDKDEDEDEDDDDSESEGPTGNTSTQYLTAIKAHDVPPIFRKWNFIDRCSDGKSAQEWPVTHYDTLRKGNKLSRTLQVTDHLKSDMKKWERIAHKKAGVGRKKALRPSERLYVRIRLLVALIARKRHPLRGAAALVLIRELQRNFKLPMSDELRGEFAFYEEIIERYVVKH